MVNETNYTYTSTISVRRFGARYYDSDASIWLSVDPMSDKYPSLSPYAYVANNPIRLVDPDGMQIDEYIFNENGKYVRTDSKKGQHRLVIENSKTGNRQTYNFADPVNDPIAIDKGDINSVEFVSKGQIANILANGGAFSETNRRNKWRYISNESSNTVNSTGAGNFDFSYSGIPINVKGASLDPERTRSLFIPEGDNYVHNHQNLGNFLWGAGGYSLGFNEGTLKVAAHVNSLINPTLNGYRSQFDSKDDQLSISRGISYAMKYGFRNIKLK